MNVLNETLYVSSMQLRIQHERYPGDSEQAARLVVLVNEVEIRDLLRHSSINKLLYQYTTETTPRQCHAHMVTNPLSVQLSVLDHSCVCSYL